MGVRSINFTETAAAPLVRLRLDLSYDGTHFSGWARQRDQRTVQGVLTELLSVILRTPVTLTVAGRTDSGVHATGQVAHIDVPEAVCSGYPADSLLKRLNRALPPDIRVHRITAVIALPMPHTAARHFGAGTH